MGAKLTRRSLLVGLAASASIGANKAPGHNIAIIGAGVSGLSAARSLSEEGLNVAVFEARNRIGGRVFTDRSFGFPIELGANWIHGDINNPLLELTKFTGTIAKTFDFDDWRVIHNDEKRKGTDEETALQDISNALYEALEDATTTDNLGKPLDHVLETNKPLLRKTKGRKALLSALIERDIIGEYGAHPRELSAALNLFGLSIDGDDLLVENGYDSIINHLAKDVNIHLNEPVLHINHRGEAAQLHTTKGTYAFDQIVVTVPLGVLKKGMIGFDPPLSSKRKSIIERTGFGNFEKAILTVDKHFNMGALNISLVSDNPWTDLIDISTIVGQPAVIAYCGAENARKVAVSSLEENRTWVLQALHAATGDMSLQAVKFIHSTWHTDEWTHGSYSFPTPRSLPTDFIALSKAESPRLFFAGEACSEYYGTVHGAFLSGQNAANLVIEARKTLLGQFDVNK